MENESVSPLARLMQGLPTVQGAQLVHGLLTQDLPNRIHQTSPHTVAEIQRLLRHLQ
jgi:hypothetical protein